MESVKTRLTKSKISSFFWGNSEKNGFIKSFFLYLILIFVGFIYIYPLLFMAVNSFMSTEDLLDPKVTWIPMSPTFDNYRLILEEDMLMVGESFKNSIVTSLFPALFQTLSAALVAFGLARFNMKLKTFWLVLIIATFVIPANVLTIPRYALYYNYNMIGTVLPAFIPSIFAQGIKSSIFILVFYQAFSTIPNAIEEAADIDGCGKFRFFSRIAMPIANSSTVLTFLFSFVWYWNELTLFSEFYEGHRTLTTSLHIFNEWYKDHSIGETTQFTTAISMAGCAISLIPIIILFAVLQKQFVTSIERSGITGE